MTEKEVEAQFPDQIIHINYAVPDCTTPQKLVHQSISGYYFDIFFNYDCSTKKLTGVKIVPDNKLQDLQALDAFSHISEKLISKYGPPSSSSSTVLISTNSIDTVVMLRYKEPAIFLIEYKQHKKEDML